MLKRGNYPNPNLVNLTNQNKPAAVTLCFVGDLPFLMLASTLWKTSSPDTKVFSVWRKLLVNWRISLGSGAPDISVRWLIEHSQCCTVDLHFKKTWVKRQPCKQLFVMVALKMKQNTDKSLSNCCCMSRRSDVAIPTAVQLMSLARSYRQYECYRTKSPWRYVVHRGAPQWAFPLREPRALWLFLRRCILV